MYASNRYERELMRLPKNYHGNAFSTAGSHSREAEDGAMPERSATEAPASPAHRAAMTPPIAVGVSETTPTVEDALPERGQGIEQEELLLLGLLWLLQGERETASRGEELRVLLLLLLLAGGGLSF